MRRRSATVAASALVAVGIFASVSTTPATPAVPLALVASPAPTYSTPLFSTDEFRTERSATLRRASRAAHRTELARLAHVKAQKAAAAKAAAEVRKRSERAAALRRAAEARQAALARQRAAQAAAARAATAPPPTPTTSSSGIPLVWRRLVQCEASGRWNYGAPGVGIDPGYVFEGGPNFTNGTWLAYGGGRYAQHAWGATPWQQIVVARRVLASQGVHAWPSCGPRVGLQRGD